MSADEYGEKNEQRPYDETILANPEIIGGSRILLHAERPIVTKTWIRGRVAVLTRKTVTTRRTFELDVLHEELVIEYEAGDGTLTLDPASDRIVVELRAEQVEISKRVRVVEEVVVSKRITTNETRVEVDVSHEQLITVET